MAVNTTLKTILTEVQACLERIDEREVRTFLSALGKAKRVFVTGQGRSGLVGRAFAKRLMHIGFEAYVAGETTTPAISKGDLLVACSASGATTTTCAHAETARKVGAEVAVLTAAATSRLSARGHVVVGIPLPSRSAQFSTTLFEQACLILLDAACLELMKRRKASMSQMQARHANLE
ncbi:MAG: SIS domain-containing protein [Planctomycetes bacterium]|nr:SIS domain-containing protein [Planctomycetota bacterium]MBM4084625.1 SIS domain-containing protein [Planctomycetota bacterium]